MTTSERIPPQLMLKLSAELRQLIRTAAGKRDMSMSEWAREVLEREARKELAS